MDARQGYFDEAANPRAGYTSSRPVQHQLAVAYPTPSSAGSRYTNQQYQSWPAAGQSSGYFPPPPRPSPQPSPHQLAAGRATSVATSTQPPRLSVSQFLDGLDLAEYKDTFLREGFDRIESLIEVQEEDFAALGIKRGHRRLIQREIATMKGIPTSTPLNIGGMEPRDEDEPTSGRESVQQTNQNTFYLDRVGPSTAEPGTKRRYRRHPKPDLSAPEKPCSAYVAYSNSVREEFKGSTMSFTDIARLVGERWSNLDKAEKESLEAHAAQEKVRYSSLLAQYKTTPEYARYQEYLVDFRKKHPATESTPAATTPQEGPFTNVPTPPSLHNRSSGEESAVEGAPDAAALSNGSPASTSIQASGASDYRKRQRLESSEGGVSGWDRELGRPDPSEHPTSDLRSSSRPLPGSHPDSFERASPG